MSNNRNMYRASTAQVDVADIRARLAEIERNISSAPKKSDDSKEITCKYDLSKHVLSYLPTPQIMGAIDNKIDASDQKTAMMTLKDKSKFLGVQADSNGMRASTIFGLDDVEDIEMDPEFDSMFGSKDMRLMALVSHNNMKHAMKQFVMANKNVLKKFRLTGTNTTVSMLKEVFGDDPEVTYGPSCKSGPLGGDAQLVAMAVTGQLGGCIFFIDPMDAHPHSADIECLVRQGNVHNILMMNNPSTAHVCLNSLRIALKMGRMEMFPSFFFDLESPSVAAYKERQNNILANAISRVSVIARIPTREAEVRASMEKANKIRLSFAQTGIAPVIEDDDDEDEEPVVSKKSMGLPGFCSACTL